MYHSFDVEIAKKYGIAEAIILNHLDFWIEKNIANDSNFFDGEYWTYNSIKAMKTLYPYMSEKKIRSALNKLKDEDLIKTGNYNKSAYDRTLWYAITEKGKSILQNGKMEIPEKGNGNTEKVKCIYTDIRTDSKNTDIETYNIIKELFSKICISYPKIVALNEERKKAIKARLKEYSLEQIEEVFKKAEKSDFLTGRIKSKGERPFKASFDWLMKPSNFIKVLEGNYDNREVNNGELRGNDAYRFKTVIE